MLHLTTSQPQTRSTAAAFVTLKIRRAFTLVEILIVVVILGILAAIVVPQFSTASQEASRVAFVTSLNAFVEVGEIYWMRNNVLPLDSSSGVAPVEFAPSISDRDWEGGTPIGGVWDMEVNDSSVTMAIGVHFNGAGITKDDTFMVEVDALLDDGDLANGSFRRLAAGRYYSIILD